MAELKLMMHQLSHSTVELLNYLEHISLLCLFVWFWFCIPESRTSFKNKLSKEAIGGRFNQVLLREKELLHSSVFHEEKHPKCPKYHQLFVHKDRVNYPTGEFQRRTGHD